MNKVLLAVFSGILLAISWPTYGFSLIIFFAFVPILVAEHNFIINKTKKSSLKVFFIAYLSFFIWNLITTHWLGFAKRPDGTYAIEALALPVLANSLLMSLIFLSYHLIKKKISSYIGLFYFILAWIAFEKFHLDWRYSFPWLNLGNVFANDIKFIQWYEFTGSFGGTLWILLINVFIFVQYRIYQSTRKKKYLIRLFLGSFIFISVPILISLLIYVNYKEQGFKANVVIVQPKLDPYKDKYTKDSLTILNDILNLSKLKIDSNTDFIIAPETAFPGRGSISIKDKENSFLIGKIKAFLNENNPKTVFISGTQSYIFHKENPENKESYNYNPYYNMYEEHFNSAIQISLKDSVKFYHKSKLVVGVEKSPIPEFLNNIIGSLVMNFGGTNSSLGTQENPSLFTNNVNKIKIAPIICYESIYGEYVSEFINKGSNLIFIMTNDSWWENSQGHLQLLSFAKIRAIENRTNIVRSANSGISCFINQKGEIISSLDYDNIGSLKSEVLVNNNKTIYSKYGDYLVRILFMIFGILLGYIFYKVLKNIFRNH